MANGLFGLGRLRRRVRPTETVGSSGTVVLSGFIERNETNAKVQGTARWKTFSDHLVNVDVVAASVRYYLNLGQSAKWTLEAADETPAAVETAEFVDDVLRDMRTPWAQVVRRGLMYRYWGFGIQEWTAKKRDDGKIGLLDVEARPAHTIERWDTDDSGHVVGVVQLMPATQKLAYLPRTKIAYVVDDSLSDSPEGLGIARQLTETATRLQRYQQLETVGFETDLQGVPKARAPYGVLDEMKRIKKITEAERVAILQPLTDFVTQHIRSVETGVMLDSATYRDQGETKAPSGVPLWDVELLTGSGSMSLQAIAAAVERLQREIARLFGTEGILLGGANVGSLALARDKSHQLAVVIDSALTELAQAYQTDLVETICTLNGIARDLWPTLTPEEMQFRDVEQLTAALGDLATAGAPLGPDDPAINVVRSLMGLPDAPEEDEVDASGRGGGEDELDDLLPPEPPPEPEPDE